MATNKESNETMAAPPPSTTDASSNDVDKDKPKFYKGQRVFAKDDTSGILYEAIVRRAMYGVDRQISEDNEKEEWHCFVHYVGWNVKWDRWVSESALYEMNDQNKELARQLQQAVKDAKKKHGRKSPHVLVELAQTMKRLEQERRLEERREELARQGIIMQEQVEGMAKDQEETTTKRNKYTKAYFQKELKLREQGLTSKRKQSDAEKLVLPFSLKKVLVEEWEIINQCNMIPTLPVDQAVTVRQVLDNYLASKIGPPKGNSTVPVEASATMEATGDNAVNGSNELESTESVQGTVATAATKMTTESTEEEDANANKKEQQEWQEMVDGIALLFDQAVGARHLLYRQEWPLLEWIQQHSEYGELRYCQVYGCEHLLRLFIRIPALLADQLTESQARPIYAKLGDFVRFLQKHQSRIFLQSYQTPLVAEESSRKRASDANKKPSAKRSRWSKKASRHKTSRHKTKLLHPRLAARTCKPRLSRHLVLPTASEGEESLRRCLPDPNPILICESTTKAWSVE